MQTRGVEGIIDIFEFLSCWRVPSESMWLLPLSYRSERSITRGCHQQICTSSKNVIIICRLRWCQLALRAHGLIREQNNNQFFIYGPQCENKLCIFGYWGGGGLSGPSIIRLGPSCFPAILSPVSIYIWKQSCTCIYNMYIIIWIKYSSEL